MLQTATQPVKQSMAVEVHGYDECGDRTWVVPAEGWWTNTGQYYNAHYVAQVGDRKYCGCLDYKARGTCEHTGAVEQLLSETEAAR